jgi:hypothetical protein
MSDGSDLGWTSAIHRCRPRLPSVRNQLAGRILAEPEVHCMLALERNLRNSALFDEPA